MNDDDFALRYSRALGAIMRCPLSRSLSLSLLHCGSCSFSRSLPPFHLGLSSPLPSLRSLSFSLSSVCPSCRFFARQPPTRSFSLARVGTSGYSLYPRFFCTLRYGASINNGPAYSVAAVSTRVVLFVRSLLLCCSHHQCKTSFDPGTTVSYVPGVYPLVNITREYFRAPLETLAITGRCQYCYPHDRNFFFFAIRHSPFSSAVQSQRVNTTIVFTSRDVNDTLTTPRLLRL